MSVLNQYSHAKRYMSFHQQFSCEVILCLEKEVTSFIETIHSVIKKFHIYLLATCNNYSTCFYIN